MIKACIQNQDVHLLIRYLPSTFHRLQPCLLATVYFSSSFARSPGRSLTLFLNDWYATLTREIMTTVTRMALIKVNWNLGGSTKRRKDRHTEMSTYKMRFMTVVFLNFGPSLVGKLEIPYSKRRLIDKKMSSKYTLLSPKRTELATINPIATLVARR